MSQEIQHICTFCTPLSQNNRWVVGKVPTGEELHGTWTMETLGNCTQFTQHSSISICPKKNLLLLHCTFLDLRESRRCTCRVGFIKKIAPKVRQHNVYTLRCSAITITFYILWNSNCTTSTTSYQGHFTVYVVSHYYDFIIFFFPIDYNSLLYFSLIITSYSMLLVWYKIVSLPGETPLDWVLTGCSNDGQQGKGEHFRTGAAHTHTFISTHRCWTRVR